MMGVIDIGIFCEVGLSLKFSFAAVGRPGEEATCVIIFVVLAWNLRGAFLK